MAINTILAGLGISMCNSSPEDRAAFPVACGPAAMQAAAELLAERAFKVLSGGLHRGDVAHFYRVHTTSGGR